MYGGILEMGKTLCGAASRAAFDYDAHLGASRIRRRVHENKRVTVSGTVTKFQSCSLLSGHEKRFNRSICPHSGSSSALGTTISVWANSPDLYWKHLLERSQVYTFPRFQCRTLSSDIAVAGFMLSKRLLNDVARRAAPCIAVYPNYEEVTYGKRESHGSHH